MNGPFSFLSRCREAWISSRRLDDRVRSGGAMRIRDAGAHERIDAELSDRRSMPSEPVSPSLGRDVMLEIQRRRAKRRDVVERTRVFHRRLSLAALALTAMAVCAWRFGPRGHQEPVAAVEMLEADVSDGFDLIGGIALADRVDEPLRHEVAALGRDTARAASAFLDQLTIEESAVDPAP